MLSKSTPSVPFDPWEASLLPSCLSTHSYFAFSFLNSILFFRSHQFYLTITFSVLPFILHSSILHLFCDSVLIHSFSMTKPPQYTFSVLVTHFCIWTMFVHHPFLLDPISCGFTPHIFKLTYSRCIQLFMFFPSYPVFNMTESWY